MSTSALESYRDVVGTLTPTAVSQYLASHHWELESRHEVKEIWRLPGADGPRGRVMLPLATDYVDFPQLFIDALYALGCIYDWDADELAERVMAARADLLFVRLDQVMTDGTIPFRQADEDDGGIVQDAQGRRDHRCGPHALASRQAALQRDRVSRRGGTARTH
ncbi:MAG: hypothetical protein ACRDTG_31505 [Pseudonocardiaceae bacterium]